ncbi:MAG: hypothetical protein U0Y10_24705 [Spirosomataceae bacterium]
MVFTKFLSYLFQKPWLAILLIILVFGLLILLVWLAYDDDIQHLTLS